MLFIKMRCRSSKFKEYQCKVPNNKKSAANEIFWVLKSSSIVRLGFDKLNVLLTLCFQTNLQVCNF